MLHLCRFSVVASSANGHRCGSRSDRCWTHLLPYLLTLSILTLGAGCTRESSTSVASPDPNVTATNSPNVTVLPPNDTDTDGRNEALLADSWEAYKRRFIQSDGRVIDWESNSRTVSEGQAYAMLRAVLIDDPDIFEQTLLWAEDNLKRPPLPNDADGEDYLWAWKWGERADGTWGIQDDNFASDADIDAVTALILASRKWDRADYLELAKKKLTDLWAQSTLAIPAVDPVATHRYLLPGPLAAFQPQPGKVYLNPSYLAPYAFRLFAQVDPDHDWMSLVDSSYAILNQTDQLSPKGLPADWVVLELATQEIQAAPAGASLKSQYSFDAYRVWWRVAWDAAWFDEPRAQAFLEDHLGYLQSLWEQQGQVPATLSLSGQALADYEATAQYAMLYPGFRQTNPDIAAAIRDRKLLATYNQGIWDNRDAYYVQNLVWLGLYPTTDVPSIFLK